MTLKELYRAVFADEHFFNAKLDAAVKEFKRVVLKANTFPIRKKYTYTNHTSNITYTIYLRAFRRAQWHNPTFSIVTTYNHDGGTTLVVVDTLNEQLFINTPHMLARLKERYMKDDSCSTWQVIDFLMDNYGFASNWVPHVMRDIDNKYDRDNREYLAIVTPLGVFFCEREKDCMDVIVYNTYLPPEMLRKEQNRRISIEYFKSYCEEYMKRNATTAAVVKAEYEKMLLDATLERWSIDRFIDESNKYMDEHPLYVL